MLGLRSVRGSVPLCGRCAKVWPRRFLCNRWKRRDEERPGRSTRLRCVEQGTRV